ncbi:MAG: CotH kinase family protein [Phocaeicola sp.]
MALTQEDIQQVLNAIKADSQGIEELPVATNLNGINSLPAIRGNEVVSAPISLLGAVAETAAAGANAARDSANTAASGANTAKTAAETAATGANNATLAATEAAALANEAAKGSIRKVTVKDKKGVTVETLIPDQNGNVDLTQGGSGSGSGFYNVTQLHPITGYYTKVLAIASLVDADIDDDEKPAMIITFEESAGKWVDYRFEATDILNFLEVSAWKRYGGGDAIKKITINSGTSSANYEADESGSVIIPIEKTIIDPTLDPNSTNPVQNKAVTAALAELSGKYGAALQLNEIGEGDDKAYSLSLLDENGNVLSTSDMFTGGGGGSVATTKIQLTRITANPTVKMGDDVRLVFNYDHIDTSTNESTGNTGSYIATITHGATSSTEQGQIAAGSSNTLNVSKYLGVGTNTVRVRVTVGEGAEMQVSQISWTVTVVQLTLTSSFNYATSINVGDTVAIPYALSGSGIKTLRCYLNGVDYEQRAITTSTANGSFSIPTGALAHGSHSVQMVCELELASGSVIKSNSIYFDLAVRGSSSLSPIVATRFDYPDGAIITRGNIPYIPANQYDLFVLNYAVYNPRETPTEVQVIEGVTLVSSAKVPFAATQLSLRAMTYGEQSCRIACGDTNYYYKMVVSQSELNLSEPTDSLQLKLSAQGRSNSDTNREEWSSNGIQTLFEGFKWGGDGWINNALRLSDNARAIVQYQPLGQPDQNANNAFAFMIKFKVSDVIDDDSEIIRCMDGEGTGFVITTQEARMMTKGKSSLAMKMAAGNTYEVGFVSYPRAVANSSDHEILNSEMVYLYINGIMSGCVQRGASDSIYQTTPQNIQLGANGATTDVYLMRSFSSYLSDSQMLDCYIIDQDTSDDMFDLYNRNDIIDGNGVISVDNVPDDMRYVVITGRQANGVATVLQAAVNNNKDTRYEVDEILCIKRSEPELNFKTVGGIIRCQGTSSMAYPIKNYRIYLQKTVDGKRVACDAYFGCDSQGVGGEFAEGGAGNKVTYSFRLPDSNGKRPAPVNCWCLKADFAESSSSHNTGMARLANDVQKAAGGGSPAQVHVNSNYEYDVRTTVDGEPCLLFYRATKDDTPVLVGKYNFNNDKSTEVVFGFKDVPGYHDADWVRQKFDGENPTECWEFLNNDYPMGMYLDDDFEAKDENGEYNYLKVFENRFPDANNEYEAGKDPYYLRRLVQWVKSTQGNTTKFRNELSEYFDVDCLCNYYIITQVFGCVDQMVKNAMLGFWYSPTKDKMLAYYIFYDNDTILGVRNDGRLCYGWDIDHNTTDPELSTADRTVYAYAGRDSILWNNLRAVFEDEITASYKRIRQQMSNDYVFSIFDTDQAARYSERVYNLDAQYKYVRPKTIGVEVVQNGVTSTVQYSYLEAMQGSRAAHRRWWLINRFHLFDARYSAGQYTLTDITWKGNSAAGATVRATPSRDFYFEFRRESTPMVHQAVQEGVEWSYSYNQTANIGTIFHLLGGIFMSKLDLSQWGGFTDLNLPTLPVLEELIMGRVGSSYTLSEIAIGTKLPMLKLLDIRNYTRLATLDLSGCNRIEEVNALGCESLSTINFVEGCPLNKLHLPANFQTLTLRSLSNLTKSNIVFQNKANITGLWVENCALIDGFELFTELFNLGNLRYVRLSGLSLEGTGSDLATWYDAGLRGIDADGNTVGRCKLIGTYNLTKYLDEATYAKFVEHFDELNIRQPQYTMIEFEDAISDDKNVSNLDNGTGYKYGNDYQHSAHISTILSKRFRCLGKQGSEGVMTIYPLHDENSNYYADAQSVANCTPASLNSSEGDAFVFEPRYWYKGINDFLNKKHYSCYSTETDMPDRPEAKVHTYDELLQSGKVTLSYKLMVDKANVAASLSADSNYSVVEIDVSQHKKVRFPTSAYTLLASGIFATDAGAIIDTITISTLELRFEDGMYLIADVPQGATKLHITILKTAEFDCVVLSNSDKIEDMEPDWCLHEECLVGLFESSIVESKLRSCVTGGASVASLSWTDFNYYSAQRKMQQIDYEMHKHIANLFFVRYGRRDSQAECGAGSNSNTRTIGGTVSYGMTDTIGFDAAKVIDPSLTPTTSTDTGPQYSWYKTIVNGSEAIVRINNSCCLGYEDIYGCKLEMMDNVSVPNSTGNVGKWFITMPDGVQRKVKGASLTINFITAVAHGKYMDVIPIGTSSGSSTTYYCDRFAFSSSTSRVVYRSLSYAYSYGGVSYAYALYDSSYTLTNIGSRLAFRRQIVKAQSVAAYRAINEIA